MINREYSKIMKHVKDAPKDTTKKVTHTSIVDMLEEFPDKVIKTVMNPVHTTNTSITDLRNRLADIILNNDTPIIHNDSLNTWCVNASEKYGLRIKDILSMSPGDTLEVIMIDRNVGDYSQSFKKGHIYDPRVKGLSYGVYTHVKDLSGIMNFTDINRTYPFTWELNIAKVSPKWYWGTIEDANSKKYKSYTDFDPNTKVGMRGPAISLKDTKKLPKYVKHYGNVWNDGHIPRKQDLT